MLSDIQNVVKSQWRPWLISPLFVWSLLTTKIKILGYSSWITFFCCASSELQFILIFLRCRFALIISSVDRTKSLCKFYFSTDATPQFVYKLTPLIDKKISLLLIEKRTELVKFSPRQTQDACLGLLRRSLYLHSDPCPFLTVCTAFVRGGVGWRHIQQPRTIFIEWLKV